MTVQVAWQAGQEYRFSGIGYAPDGEIERDGARLTELPTALRDLLTTAILCNDAVVRLEQNTWTITGDPTEAALVAAAEKAGLPSRISAVTMLAWTSSRSSRTVNSWPPCTRLTGKTTFF